MSDIFTMEDWLALDLSPNVTDEEIVEAINKRLGIKAIQTSGMRDLNLRFYAASAEPPKEAQKPFTKAGGFSGTDINAMWRIKQLTELFGPCGLGWYIEVTHREIMQYDVLHQKAFVDINLYIRDPVTGEWSKPITGTGGNDWVSKRKSGDVIVNDECFKMAETDAIGSACKKLGFGATIYWSQDKTKYTMDEDGNFVGTVISEEEARQEKRTAIKEQSKDDPFFGKEAPAETPTEAPKPSADTSATEASVTEPAAEKEDNANIRQATACRKAIDQWISEDYSRTSNEIIAEYVKINGPMDQWKFGTMVHCYKDLRDSGEKLKEVNL